VSLAAVRVASAEAPPHALVMLHGIYGRGRNWQSIARAVVAARPDYSCWLVDLPHHGDSPAGEHGDTITGLAADVADWLAAEHLAAHAVLGHSYGGKVALAVADAMRDKPLQVWVIDSTPESRAPWGSAWGMLAFVGQLPPRFRTREEAVAALVDGGYARGVAQWMASNLVREDGGFVWGLDFDAMERLLRHFFETDLWRVIESPAATHDIHIVKASESHAISQEAVHCIEAMNRNVHLHHLTGGHWIHAESPQAITALLVEHLPSGLT
jgi:esterase